MVVNYRTLAVNGTGNGAAQNLIVPGVTKTDEQYVLERDVKLHLNSINLSIGAAATVIIKIGDKEVFRDVLTAAGVITADMVDESYLPIVPLTINVSNGVTYIGSIVWSFEPYGKKPVKTEMQFVSS
jgi:hypothetical protein